jgi:hypothetical protein
MQLSLQESIAECLAQLEADPLGDLKLGLRRRTLAELGERYTEGDRRRCQGLRRRTKLARASIERALPVWDVARPTDDMPRRLLRLADSVLGGEIEPDAAWAERAAAWTALDDIAMTDEDTQLALAPGYGAAQVLACAIADEILDFEDLDDLTDRDVDPEELDPAFFAAAAISGGAAWDEASLKERRRAFWRWWLEEALPAAVADG